jgi:hypothetical protein
LPAPQTPSPASQTGGELKPLTHYESLLVHYGSELVHYGSEFTTGTTAQPCCLAPRTVTRTHVRAALCRLVVIDFKTSNRIMPGYAVQASAALFCAPLCNTRALEQSLAVSFIDVIMATYIVYLVSISCCFRRLLIVVCRRITLLVCYPGSCVCTGD